MTDTKRLPLTSKIRVKDVANQMNVSRTTASKYYKDMLSHYKTPILCQYHLFEYLNIPIKND